jgi:DNA-binding MarR family transcriptional regulator
MDSLASDLRIALGRISRRLRRLYADAEPGIGFLSLAVMNRIDREGTTSPGSLASGEGVTSAAVAACLTSLEADGLVTREPDPADGRRVVVSLTAAGKRALQRRDEASVARLESVLRTFSSRERQALAAALPLLERLATSL